MDNKLFMRQLIINQMSIMAALLEEEHGDIANTLLVEAFNNSKRIVKADNYWPEKSRK